MLPYAAQLQSCFVPINAHLRNSRGFHVHQCNQATKIRPISSSQVMSFSSYPYEQVDVGPNTSQHGELRDHEQDKESTALVSARDIRDSTPDEIPVARWFTIIKPEPEESVLARGFVPGSELRGDDHEQTASTTDTSPRIEPAKITCQVCGIGYDSAASLNKHLSLKKDQLHRQYHYRVYQPTPSSAPLYRRADSEEAPDNCDETPTDNMDHCTADTKKRYQCTVCQKMVLGLSSHMKTHVQPKTYQCNIYYRGFIKPHTLAYHMHTHQSDAVITDQAEETYKCVVCSKTFSSSASLASHYSTHGEKKPYKCKICQKEYKLHSSYTLHMKSHSGEHLYTCHICQRGFICYSGLATHMRTHNNDKPHKCDVCQKEFVLAANLATHKRLNHEQQTYQCDICQKTYTKQSLLEAHLKLHAVQDSELHECDICKKRFRDSSYLKLHMESHNKERPYQCDICQKRFTMASYLTAHMRTHTGERPYQCEVCQKRFAQISTLIGHAKTHLKDKPFQCHVCGKNVSTKRSLDNHMLRLHMAK